MSNYFGFQPVAAVAANVQAQAAQAAQAAYTASIYRHQPAVQTYQQPSAYTMGQVQVAASPYTATASVNPGYAAAPIAASTYSYIAQQPQQQIGQAVLQQTQQQAIPSQIKPQQQQVSIAQPTGNYGFEAALYNAANSIIQQKQKGTYDSSSASYGTSSNKSNNWSNNRNQQNTNVTSSSGANQKRYGSNSHYGSAYRQSSSSVVQPMQYCDVCKISCAGSQTYKEHLEGQKHKKKEAAIKAIETTKPGQKTYYCELCDVTCTSTDAYNAHVRGTKHQKVVKLHQKMGKPVPPGHVVTVKSAESSQNTAKSTAKSDSTGKLSEYTGGTSAATKTIITDGLLKDEDDPEPVGGEYIEELQGSDGKIVQFHCKLCDCKFNDPNAKDMHLKGRRHRIQYKRKVNPELHIDMKPSFRTKRIQEDRNRKNRQREEFHKRKNEEMAMIEEMRRMEDDLFMRFGAGGRRPETHDDRHVMAKHQAIYPTDAELEAVQKIVSRAEQALKKVSDKLNDEDANDPKIQAEIKAIAAKKQETEPKGNTLAQANDDVPSRQLKGVMRIGLLAKGLLLKGDNVLEIAVLCMDRPTRTLLARVFKHLTSQMAELSEEKYDYELIMEDCAIIVKATQEPYMKLHILLTSPVVREQSIESSDDPINSLSREKCLATLAELRHAKWFQATATHLASCVIVIRIMRDLINRVPSWKPLSQWALELLVEKALNCVAHPLSPGDALRRVFECIASGLLLNDGPGLIDPCEKEPVDAAKGLRNQDREDITASGQHALRLLTFRLVHKVLGIEALPSPNSVTSTTRKRRCSDQIEVTAEETKAKKESQNAS